MLSTCIVVAAMTHGVTIRYEYVPLPDRLVAYFTPEALVLGKLTADGEFREGWSVPLQSGVLRYSGPKHTKLPIGLEWKGSAVYELREGSLVPGRVNNRGEFVADAKAKPVPFAEYAFTPGDPPVWNLPGEFRPMGLKRDKEVVSPVLRPTEKPPGGRGSNTPAAVFGSGGAGTHGGFVGDGTWRDRYAQVRTGGR